MGWTSRAKTPQSFSYHEYVQILSATIRCPKGLRRDALTAAAFKLSPVHVYFATLCIFSCLIANMFSASDLGLGLLGSQFSIAANAARHYYAYCMLLLGILFQRGGSDPLRLRCIPCHA